MISTGVLYICIALSGLDDPHTFTEPEEGIGHVAYSYSMSFIDLKREASVECELAHGETCETYCYESRGE